MGALQPRTLNPLARFGHLLFLMANLGIAAWYLLASAWVLGGLHVEVLTGDSYEWPLRVLLVSFLVAVVGILMVVCTFRLGHGKWYGRVLVSCIVVLALLEFWEGIALALLYGWHPTLVKTPVLLTIWALIGACYLRTRLRPNNSFKPNPHRGGA